MEISVASPITVKTLFDVEELKQNFSTDLLFSIVKNYDEVKVNAKIAIVKGIEELSSTIQEKLEQDNFVAPDSFWLFLAAEYPFDDLIHSALRNMPVDTSVTFMTDYAPNFTYVEYQQFCDILSKTPKSNVYGLPLSYIEKIYPFESEND